MMIHLIRSFLKYVLFIFYPAAVDANPFHVFATTFFMQKIVGFNRMVPWPVHFTSRILYRKRITVGRRSYPGWSQGCYIQARNGIEIGYNLRMGPNVGLISSDHDLDNFDSWTICSPIRIGSNVWLGMNVVVTAGVTIGDNVVIGANSVVTRDIPSNCIAAGAPCRVIRDKPPYMGYDYSH